MVRAVFGVLILGAMGGAGVALIRPLVNRPVFTIGAHLSEPEKVRDALERGARFAIEERDGRAGRFRVAHVRSPHCCWERDNSNSSYAALGGWADGYLPGLAHPRTWVDGEGNLLVSLSPPEEGRRIAQALPILGYQSILVATRRLGIVPKRTVKPGTNSTFVELGIRAVPHPPALGTAAESLLDPALASFRVLEGMPGDVWEGAVDAVYLTPRTAETAFELRENGFEGALFVPASLVEPPDGGLVILARLKPPPADFVRRSGSSDPFAWAAYRSCLRLLDALDRSTECGYDPFSDPEVATLGVYRVQAGRFELVRTLP